MYILLHTNILTSCRNEIMGNIDERLKTCPSGFPRDWQYVDYLRQKDYCCWHQVPDVFFQGDQWLDAIVPMFRAAKPMMDMMNAVIDDYE